MTFPNDPDALKALIGDMAGVRVPKSPKKEKEATAENPPGGETAPAETSPEAPDPKAEPVPAPTEAEPPAETTPEGETETETEPEAPAGEVPPEAGKLAAQYRFRPKDEVEALAMSIRKAADKRGKPISLKDALAQAETILQKDEPGAAPVNHDDAITAAQAEVESLWTEHQKLYGEDLDFKKAAETLRKIDAAKEKLASLRQAKADQSRQQESSRREAFNRSMARAVELYPDSQVDGSALVKRIGELDQQMRETGNPLFNDPNKPLVLCQMAANELRIVPRTPGAKAPVAAVKPPAASSQPVPTRPVQPAKPSAPLASGAARTTQANPQVQAQAVLDGIKTPEDIYRLTEAMEMVGG